MSFSHGETAKARGKKAGIGVSGAHVYSYGNSMFALKHRRNPLVMFSRETRSFFHASHILDARRASFVHPREEIPSFQVAIGDEA
ncbi:hypothetical protein IB270_30465 [Ensifer sp. ENS05]|uniref:hypothetical protein n=1 Tax=Ensifer sp. ENS05 TaxID=2769277 RepID=UPI0017836BDD|nr:hypothetical protein [Ensifer sp. ENS05]MBD9597162.1 hypothetical protein [Ensifer sp. ENS05]